MAAAKLEVVSSMEINSIEEMFRGISPMLMDIYKARTIAKHLIHNGYTTAPAKFKMAEKTGK
jgi:hypothetical protein